MPSISKIRFTNVVYEDGMKRYNDEIFKFDGFNGAILLENGGGKTVFIQTALQAIIPHTSLADRKIKQTLQLDNYPAHVAIEWIISENPRRYLVTAVSLFLTKNGLDSYRYVHEYGPGYKHDIDGIPFVRKEQNRAADRGEISDYYQQMSHHMNAKTFQTIKEFQAYIEDQYHIVANEWESIVKINSTEGGVEAFFDECKQTNQLLDRLLIPTVENAISGHDKNTFADTFDKHRASFKLYKELKEQIEENKAIEVELESYVSRFERLHETELTYEYSKQRAKGLLQIINQQEQEQQRELEGVHNKLEQWEQDNKHNEMQHASLLIQEERSELDEMDKLYMEAERSLEEAKGGLKSASNTYYSLKLADLKQIFHTEMNRVDYYEKQLAQLDEQVDITKLKEQLDENSELLMGYFSNELEQLAKKEHSCTIELQALTEQLKQAKQELHEKSAQWKDVQSTFDQIIGTIKNKQHEMNVISQRILANPEQENVKEKIVEWNKRHQYLDSQIVALKSENNRLTKVIEETSGKIEKLKEDKNEKDKMHVQVDADLKQMNKAHDVLKDKLSLLRPQWSQMESIYLKQDSIEQQFYESIQKLAREQEDRLQKERLAHRLLDDHGEQDLFFADPFLEKQIKQWSNQFTFIETGVKYIQGINVSLEEVNKTYPLWPMTVITTEKEKELLQQKVQHISDRIQLPIAVLSTEEVRAIVQDGNVFSEQIVPDHWLKNQHKEQFTNWKKGIKAHANTATEARKEIEKELAQWKQILNQYQSFLGEFPYSVYQHKQEELLQLQDGMQILSAKIKEMETENKKNQEKINTQRARMEDYHSEFYGLENKLNQALRYMDHEKELAELVKDQERITSQKKELEKVINSKERLIDNLDEQHREQRDLQKEVTWYRGQILEDDVYNEVKHVKPKYSDENKAVLLEIRQDVKMQLKEISKTRGEVEANLINAKDKMDNARKHMEDVRREQGPLDESLTFPPNGQERMKEIFNHMEHWKKEEADRSKKRDVNKSKRDKQEQKEEGQKQHFENIFPKQQPVVFTESLALVKERLNEKRDHLEKQKSYLEKENGRISLTLQSIRNAYTQLDRYEEAHHFKGPSVAAIDLNQEEIQSFSYNRVPFVKELTSSLKENKQKVTNEWENVNRAKDTFKAFCKNKITNVKMREMVVQGIDHKRTYSEIMEFQSHMKKRVKNAIRIAEETIIGHDQKLEQLITYMHSHLRTITHELEIIPRKTKVKVNDKWKEIYKFSIPDWTEEEGKERLRNHIEWIVEQLEKDSYLNEEGKEDAGKVRKDIETWLQSKQLLRIVLNNEMIKITCRKVTNDNQVTTRSYSWEQSNVWSGGEKWSKNMTLFLGILNYVAEKQKHVQTNMKRHRTVILDNPFGKASSDHVLNPVFFIAEQLGFQIIALTAHAEGKFLRDYFPVIYSCRLRPAQDPTKQIMTKEKQLHHAYFQDFEPQALERLGEVEQIELF